MKTILMYDDDTEIRFVVSQGDQRKFHGIYIESTECDEDLQSELCELLYDIDGVFIGDVIDYEQAQIELTSGAYFAICGQCG